MTVAETLNAYLRGMVSLHARLGPYKNIQYVGIEDFLLREGTAFSGRAGDCALPHMRIGNCYENAFRVAMAQPEYRYYEGWALMGGIIPCQHAWLVDADGKVHDPTWASLKYEQDECAWVGIHIPLPAHIDWFLHHNTMNIVSVGEMVPRDLLYRGMDLFSDYDTPADAMPLIVSSVLEALADAGEWELNEETKIFTNSKTGKQWCGVRQVFI